MDQKKVITDEEFDRIMNHNPNRQFFFDDCHLQISVVEVDENKKSLPEAKAKAEEIAKEIYEEISELLNNKYNDIETTMKTGIVVEFGLLTKAELLDSSEEGECD